MKSTKNALGTFFSPVRGGAPEEVPPPDVQNPPGETPASVPAENWRDSLIPADLKDDPSLKDFKSPQDIVKSFVETKRAYGKKMDGMIRVPTATSSPEDRNAFSQAIGVPRTPQEYTFDVAEEFKKFLPDQALDRFRPIFHKLDIPSSTAQSLLRAYGEDLTQQRIEIQQAYKAKQDEMRDEVGQATWDRNLAIAEAGVNYLKAKLGEEDGESFAALLDDTLLGDHPLLIKVFTVLGRELAEDGHFQVDGVAGGMVESAKEYILASYNPGHPASDPGSPEHERALEKRGEMYRLLQDYDPNWRAFDNQP